MDMSLNIKDFHAILTSEKDGSPLLMALRKLRDIQGPQEIVALAEGPLEVWTGWHAPQPGGTLPRSCAVSLAMPSATGAR